MKYLSIAILCIAILSGGCKKDEEDPNAGTPVPTSAVNGKWKYDSNVGTGCTTLVASTMEIKNGEAVFLSVPPSADIYGFKVGEKIWSGITQTTSPNNFSAIGYTRNTSGSVNDPNLKIAIVIQANGQEMIATYPKAACNPVQKYTKIN